MANEVPGTQLVVVMTEEMQDKANKLMLRRNWDKLYSYLHPPNTKYVRYYHAHEQFERILRNVDEVISLLMLYREYKDKMRR